MKILSIIMITLFSAHLITPGESNNEYDQLWKEVEEFQTKNLPKSAFDIVEKIFAKAKKEKRDDQIIKSVIYKAILRSQFEDNDPAEYIKLFEAEKNQITHPAAKAIYASMLGELYQQYGMQNIGRFSDRTADDDRDKSDIELFSLEEIQQKSIAYYIESLSYNGNDDFINFTQLFEFKDESHQVITASTIREFLLFRSLEHFINDQSFITLPHDGFNINDESYFASAKGFVKIDIEDTDQYNYKRFAIKLFQRALQMTASKRELNVALDIKRIEYLYNQSNSNDKVKLYLNGLIRIITDNENVESTLLAHVKIIEHHLRQSELYNGSFEQKYAHHTQEAYRWIQRAKKSFPKAALIQLVETQKNRLNQVYLNCETEQVTPPNKDFILFLNYKNIKKAYFKLVKIESSDLDRFNKINNNPDRIKFIESKELIKKWDQDLPASQDFNYHGVELPVPGLKTGNYVILSSNTEDFKIDAYKAVCINFINVSSMNYLHSVGDIKTEIFVTNRTTGEAISNVKVEVYSHEYDYTSRRYKWDLLNTIATDNAGYVSFDEVNRNFSFKLTKGRDVLDLRQRHYNRKDSPNRSSKQIHLFTDRAIYRPGQLIYFKGLITESDESQIPVIVPNSQVNVVFKDANWQTVYETQLTSNDFGSFNGVITAPTDVLTGLMTIECRSGNGSGSQRIRVEEYKRPKIYAEIDSLKDSYKLGDSILISGVVKSFSGLDIQEAKIKYTVTRNAHERYFRGYFRPPVNRTNEWVVDGETVSGTDGKFDFKFKSKSGDQAISNYIYQVNLEITDITGESTFISKSIVLGNEPFRLIIDLPQFAFNDELDEIGFEVLNSDHKQINASIGVEVISLEYPRLPKRSKLWKNSDQYVLKKEAYELKFPFDEYSEGNDPSQWNTIETVSRQKLKSEVGKISSLANLNQGVYKVVITVTDDNGFQKQYERYVSISERKNECLPTQHLWTTSIKKEYKAGEILKLAYFTPYASSDLFYKIGRQYETLQSEWISNENNTIEVPITEDLRGGFSIDLIMVKHGRVYSETHSVEVPWDNKKLNISYESFRDNTLPNSEEEWIIRIKDDSNSGVGSEVLASMYDASLDQFVKHQWQNTFYPNYASYISWNGVGFGRSDKYYFIERNNQEYYSQTQTFAPVFNWFGFYMPYAGRRDFLEVASMDGAVMKRSHSLPMVQQDAVTISDESNATPANEESSNSAEVVDTAPADPFSYRENLNETVFFFPEMKSENGELELKFKMNEALTRWNFMLFSHTKDLSYVFDTKSVVTQKPLMIEPHLPRFFREGDKIFINAKVSNLSGSSVDALVDIDLQDFISEEDLNSKFVLSDIKQNVVLTPGQSKIVEWEIEIPQDFKSALNVKIKAVGGEYSDGEANVIPVLSNRILVTESMPMHVESNVKKIFEFDAMLKMQGSETLKNHLFSIEFTNNPSWLVLKSIPFLLDNSHVSSDALINSFYGTLLAHDMISKNSEFGKAIRLWDQNQDWESQLTKNSDLKLSQLEETPWVREAKSEEENMKKLKVLLDDNYVEQKLKTILSELKNRQQTNGGFSWQPGGKDNWYITQYILESLGRLTNLIDRDVAKDKTLVKNALHYIDLRLLEYYNEDSKEETKKYVSPTIIHYFYTRSFYRDHLIDNKVYPAFLYYLKQIKSNWTTLNTYQQAIAGIALNKWNERETSEAVFKSLNERMVQDLEIGNYWNDQAGYYWYNPNIEKQSVMIEFFKLMKSPRKDIDGLKLWLLKNKQTHKWETTKATVSAIYAFMLDSNDWLTDKAMVKIVLPKLNQTLTFDKKSVMTSYVRKDWNGDDIQADMSTISVENPNKHVSWGAAHWQYFETLNNIKKFDDNPLSITKSIFKISYDSNGEQLKKLSDSNPIHSGDRLRTRIEISVDRPMEFIELKDLRSSGLEPVHTLSSYKWQDGLGYYQTTKDVATYFFIDYLPKGKFVFEYDLISTHKGVFSNGISNIECVYAPEFSSHSEGLSLEIK